MENDSNGISLTVFQEIENNFRGKNETVPLTIPSIYAPWHFLASDVGHFDHFVLIISTLSAIHAVVNLPLGVYTVDILETNSLISSN